METSPINRTSISEQIFEQLKERIIRGEIKPGEKLPSENELCKIFGVSRTTVRQALSNLNSLGLIEKKMGEGSYVKNTNDDIITPIMSQAYLSQHSLTEIVEMRRLLEPTIAAYACERASEDVIASLYDIYHQMEKSINDKKKIAKLDCEFHILLIKASGNTFLTRISEIISDILISAFFDTVSKKGSSGDLRYYKELLEAFDSRNPDKVREIMQYNMDEKVKDLIE